MEVSTFVALVFPERGDIIIGKNINDIVTTSLSVVDSVAGATEQGDTSGNVTASSLKNKTPHYSRLMLTVVYTNFCEYCMVIPPNPAHSRNC